METERQYSRSERNEIYKDAVQTFGSDLQFTIAIEELAELIQVISKWKRKHIVPQNLVEELADVEIMLEQLEVILDADMRAKIDLSKSQKVKRLTERLQAFKEKI